MLSTFPQPLPLLHKLDLLKLCESQDVTATDEMAPCVEKETRLQSGSNLWFRYHLTTSQVKAVCCTAPTNPSQNIAKNHLLPRIIPLHQQANNLGM